MVFSCTSFSLFLCKFLIVIHIICKFYYREPSDFYILWSSCFGNHKSQESIRLLIFILLTFNSYQARENTNEPSNYKTSPEKQKTTDRWDTNTIRFISFQFSSLSQLVLVPVGLNLWCLLFLIVSTCQLFVCDGDNWPLVCVDMS